MAVDLVYRAEMEGFEPAHESACDALAVALPRIWPRQPQFNIRVRNRLDRYHGFRPDRLDAFLMQFGEKFVELHGCVTHGKQASDATNRSFRRRSNSNQRESFRSLCAKPSENDKTTRDTLGLLA